MDSNFAGLVFYKDPHNTVYTRSLSWYSVTFANCLILWVSKIQTEISLPTLHVEYVTLSQSLRNLLPVKDLAKETLKGLGLNTKKIKAVTKSSLFEDNSGAIVVALSPRLNPTSKFIAVKYH